MNEKINKTVKINITEGLKTIYPEVFEDGKVNFEKLKSLLNGDIIEKEDDRFYFNWAGKSNIYKLIQAPAYGTLKPDEDKSVDFDDTENIVIAGENLETLKLLLKPYFGKVKMIYIDPPYNTGKDFIYRDNFKEPVKDYLEKTGQIDSDGKKLTTNTEASGRYHSDWLNFMYPRLFLARSLLRDDGVIFISIDDNEVHHLRMIMDEIFGEENFVAVLVRKSGIAPRQDAKYIATQHDYVVCYSKNINEAKVNRKISEAEGFDFEDEFVNERGKYRLNKLDRGSIHYSEGLDYPVTAPDGSEIWPGGDPADKRWTWRWSRDKVKWGIENGFIVFKKVRNEQWSVYYKEYELVDNEGNTRERTNPFDTFILEAYNEKGNTDVSNLFENRVFEYPKPVDLIKHLLKIASDEKSIIMDFFAGSGTTGHAVWDLDKEDGGNRKFILVQLDEEVKDEEIKKEFPTVADICIERLKRVSEKYRQDEEGSLLKNNHDFGFKVFKLSQSNFNLKDEFEFDPSEDIEELKKKYLDWLGAWVDNPLVGSWTEMDIIYEVILKEGLNLNSKIDKIKIKDNDFYYVKDEEQNLDFYISLQNKFTAETIEEIRTTKYKGKTFVFLDNALTDNDKINLSVFVRVKVI